MILLKSVLMKSKEQNRYPFHLPFFNQEVSFSSPVTILIGDNGSGKSTFLEIIRSKLNLYKIGQLDYPFHDVDFKSTYPISKPKGLYFSSEDFTTYIQGLEKEKAWSKERLEEIIETYQHKSKLSQSLATMPHQRTLHDIDQLHDRNLNESSHGEAYLSFFKSRMRSKQLILLDEPETPLSFQNQLALIYLIKEAVDEGSQFIIATHSPVMMAYPNAEIYEMTEDGFKKTHYEEVEQVKLLKSFLNDKDYFFRHLFQ